MVLLGWLGAQNRIMQEYAHVWQASSLVDETKIVAPGWLKILHRQSLQAQISNIAINKRTILHVFSTAGLLALAELLWLCNNSISFPDNNNELVSSPAGLVFDSGPGRVSASWPTCKGIAAGMLQARADAFITSAAAYVLQPAVQVLVDLQQQRFDAVNSLWHVGNESSLGGARFWNAPQLYLTTQNDAVINEDEILTFLHTRKQENVKRSVSHKRVHDCPHCELLRYQPSWYSNAIMSFIESEVHA